MTKKKPINGPRAKAIKSFHEEMSKTGFHLMAISGDEPSGIAIVISGSTIQLAGALAQILKDDHLKIAVELAKAVTE